MVAANGLLAEHGTPTWYASRKKADVTASAAAQMVGVGWGSRAAAWRKKTGMPTAAEAKTSDYTQSMLAYGQETEPLALASYGALTGAQWTQVPYGELEMHGRIHGATPDAIAILPTNEVVLVEVKCPVKELHTKIKPQYWIQIIEQMVVWKIPRIHFYVYKPGVGAHLWDIRLTNEMREWVYQYYLPALAYFFRCVDAKEEPKRKTLEEDIWRHAYFADGVKPVRSFNFS